LNHKNHLEKLNQKKSSVPIGEPQQAAGGELHQVSGGVVLSQQNSFSV